MAYRCSESEQKLRLLQTLSAVLPSFILLHCDDRLC